MNRFSVSPIKVFCCLFVWIQVTMAVENISDPVHTELVCERSKYLGWTTLEAKCGFGDVIHVIRANYGRTSLLPCNDDNLSWDVDCDSPESNEIVKQRCDQKGSCEIPLKTSVFGDPCNGTEKYLEMDYQCKPGKPLLLTADGYSGIQAIDIETSESYHFAWRTKIIRNIVAFDYVYRTKTIVWSDGPTRRIYSAPIESRGLITTVSRNTIQPVGLAVDWIHDKFYWTDIGKKTIAVANLDGSWLKTLFKIEHSQLGPIVVDPIEGWMFWTDWSDQPKIERAGMDGSHRSAIVSTDIVRPCSIAVDLSSRRIYWMDARKNAIYSANYDGTVRVKVLTSDDLTGPASISVFEGYAYWTDLRSTKGKIHKMKLGGRVSKQLLVSREWTYLEDIKIFHNSQQPAGPNRCGTNNGGCSHLCLPTPKLHDISTPDSKPFICACPNQASNCSGEELTEIDPIHTELVCEQRTLEAKCGFGEVIYVVRANYGRTSLLPCNDENLIFDVNCDFEYAKDIMEERCDQKRSCEVPATSSVFGDRCGTTKKYLEMDYQCKPGQPLLLTADGNSGVLVNDLRTSKSYPLDRKNKIIRNITAFDYVYRTKTVVWTDSLTRRIYSAPIESRGLITTVTSNTIQPVGLAVDWIHDKLYWTDIGKKTIAVANLDGRWEKTLFETEHRRLGPIVVDPIEGLMFWTDWSDEPKIERAGLDGSNRSAIISTSLSRPYSISVDLSSRRIYWIDANKHAIYSAKYDGTGRENVFASDDVQESASLSVFEGYVYWTKLQDSNTKVYKTKSGIGYRKLVLNEKEWTNLVDIKIFHNSQQPAGPNRCGTNNGGCSHLCLPTPKLHGISTPDSKPYRCACPNQASNCSEEKLTEIDDQLNEFNTGSSQVDVVSIIMNKIMALVELVGNGSWYFKK